jgi:hypothetical protein
MADVTAGPELAGESRQRVCKRPGCGDMVPVPARGRTRLFCGDACGRYLELSRQPGL